MKAAKLDENDGPPLRMHDLRHAFASMSIASGQSVVSVSHQLGHSSPDLTLSVYSHLFNAEEHAERARRALDQAFNAALGGNDLETGGGDHTQRQEGQTDENVLTLRTATTKGN